MTRAAADGATGARHIAIVGAGLAGLSCAVALEASGHRVSLFDKSRAASGRMSTRDGKGASDGDREGEDWQCDHGAQYFTARDAAFRAEVARWQQAGVADVWHPRIRVFGAPSTELADSAEPSQRASPERFVGTPRMTAPARWIARKLALTPHTTVRELRRAAEGWQLMSAEHGWLVDTFDAVLLAIPAPQAVALLEASKPAPANLIATARSARMRPCWALMARFDPAAGLPFDGTLDVAFVNEGSLRWIARDSSKPGRTGPETWALHANAEWSRAHLDASAQDVAAALTKAFVDLGGCAPSASTAHRWLYSDTEPALDAMSAWNPEHRIGLCGDWLAGGKVEGAWRSGRALAAQIARRD